MRTPLQTIIVAGDDAVIVDELVLMVKKLGYHCLAQTTATSDVLPLVQRHHPQLLVMPFLINKPEEFDALKQILSLAFTAVIVDVGDISSQMTQTIMDAGASGFLLRPIDIRQLRAVLESAWHQFQNTQSLRAEMLGLKDQLETRKLVDRAKGILMEARGISEPEAYRLLQRMSQDKRMSIKEVCKAVEHIQMVVGTKARKKAA